ncbi:Fc.00g005830.m01.CDS01 [Cosmosporella sp. VM-42]
MAAMTEQHFAMFPPHNNDAEDFARYSNPSETVFTSGPLDMSIPADAFGAFPRSAHEVYPTTLGFESTLYAEAPNYMLNSGGSPSMYTDDTEMRLPSSSLSTASAPSAASSAIGSPQSNHGQMGAVPEWPPHGLGVQPTIVGNDYLPGSDYSSFSGPGMEELAFDFGNNKGFVGESEAASTPRCPQESFNPSLPSRSSTSASAPVVSGGMVADRYPPVSSAVTSTSITTRPCPSKRQLSLSAIPSTETFRWSPQPVSHCTTPTPINRAASFFPQSSIDCLSRSRNSPGIALSTMIADSTPPSTDPSLIHEVNRPPMGIPAYDAHFHQAANHPYPTSPSVSSSSPQPNMMRTNSSSPFLHNNGFQPAFPGSPYGAPMDTHVRRPSMGHFPPPTPGEYHSGDETKEKQRCTYPDCGKVFKDLKAHMLTHQNERPEKCPIQTCEYHVKGFARKYDKNRHTLTHYKGTMVCGFCPGSGSAAEKSFNRADVFKRHLTAVHGVEQTPPNSRKKTAAGANNGKKLTGYAPDATGKCSTCSQTFSNAQDFYEHLDDCVLRIVQQEDPAEAINAKRLAEVENDKDVHQTLEKNNLPTVTETTTTEEEDEEMETDEDDVDDSSKTSMSPNTKKKGNPANGVQKSRGVTHSRGGVTLTTKNRGRKNRRDYPSSWGFDKGQMTMKKRVMAVFDGPRRLAKDDMMLSTDHEVRIKLSDGKSYVTDLDVQTLKRAEGFLGATDEEKGPWISDDPNEDQLKEMQQMLETN